MNSGILAQPTGRITWEELARLLTLAAQRTACPHFGLLAGREWRLSDHGLLGELVRNSSTVDAALHELVVNQHLNSEGALAFLLRQGDAVDLGYAIYVPFAESTRQIYDAVLAAGANIMCELCGDGWRASEVLFPHSSPLDVAPYLQCFKAPLRFDSAFSAIRFSPKWLAQPVRGADPDRLRAAQARASDDDKAVLVDKTFRALRTLLLQGKASGGDVAQALAMHRRTLNRRLNAEGANFGQVLDRVRFAVAKELLEDSEVSLAEIAHALGYAHDAALLSAFRRWTGTTPGAWRLSSRTTRGPAA